MSESLVEQAVVVGRALTEATHTARAPIIGAEPRAVFGRTYIPRSIEVRYKRSLEHGWRAGWISLYGPQVRKDGSVGTREIDETLWLSARGNEGPIPGWAQGFYEENLPSRAAAVVEHPGGAT